MSYSVKQIAKILVSNMHLHIVQIFGQFGKDFKIFSLVMEHMHQDLQSYLEDGVNNSLVLSNLPIAMDIMLQGIGMQSMHQSGIAHRNFKFPHVFFNYPSQEMAKVGYIQAKASLCSLSHIIDPHGISLFDLQYHLGTTRWMAPKLILNNTSHNMEIYNPFKVDVYSYAIICFEILTRVIPFAKIHVKP
jgi:serine/threonine protein kinase